MNNTIKKIVAGVVALTCAVWMTGVTQAVDISEMSLTELQELLTSLQARITELGGEEAAPAIEGCTITDFDRNLSQGMSGDDVNCLQIILNSASDTQLAASGVGSPGEETSYFGPLTLGAVIKFQEKYADEVLASWGLTSGTGYVGSTTRAKLNELLTAEEEEEEEEEVVPEGLTSVSPAADATDVAVDAEIEAVFDVALDEDTVNATSVGLFTDTTTTVEGTISYDSDTQTITFTPGEDLAYETEYTVTLTTDITADDEAVLDEDYSWSFTTEEEEEVAPGLTVALAADTPIMAALTFNAVSVPFLKVDFTAGSEEDATIEDLTLTRVGPGAANNFEAVYLYIGGIRLTDGRSISRSTNQVTFTNVDYSIEAGETATLTVKGDLDPANSTGNMNGFQITSADDITTSAEISGTFPITGNLMSVTTAEGGKITIDEAGVDTPVNIGDTEVTISSFDVEADGEDISLQSITLTQNGSADLDDLANIVVEKDGESVGEITISGDQLIITFTDEVIEDGDSETYDVKADITASVRPDPNAIVTVVEENYDVVAIGQTYGFGVNVENEYDGAEMVIEVKGGAMNLSYSGPKTQDISAGDNAKIFTFKVANADELKVKVISFEIDTVDLDSDGINDYFDDYRLIDEDTGRTIDTADTVTDSIVAFTNDFILASGETDLSVLVDIGKEIYTEGDVTFAVNLQGFGDADVKDLDTSEYLDPDEDIVPNGLTGKDQTVIQAGLDITMASTPAEQTYVAGKKDAKLAGFAFEPRGAENIIVKDLTFEIGAATTGGAIADADIKLIVSSVYLTDGAGNVVASGKNVSSDAEVDFDSINWELEANESETLIAVGDIRPDAVDNTGVETIQFTLAAASYKTKDTKKTGDADGTPAEGQEMKIGVGVLSVKLDASTPKSAIAVAGEEDVSFSIYTFEADTEDFELDKITVGGWATGTTDNLEAIYLKSSEGTETKTTITGTTTVFTGLGWTVKEGKTLKVTVLADIRDLSDDAAQSDESFSIQLGEDATSTYAAFRAIGQSSDEVLGEDDLTVENDLTANEMTVYESKPYVEFVSLTNTELTLGAPNTVYKFSVEPDDVGDEVIMDELRLKIVPTNITDFNVTGTIGLYDLGDELVATGTYATTTNIVTFTTLAEEVSAEAPYYIKATLVGTEGEGETTKVATYFKDADDAFVWSDDETEGIDSELLTIPDNVATLKM